MTELLMPFSRGRVSGLPKVMHLLNGEITKKAQLSQTWKAVLTQTLLHIIKRFRVSAS